MRILDLLATQNREAVRELSLPADQSLLRGVVVQFRLAVARAAVCTVQLVVQRCDEGLGLRIAQDVHDRNTAMALVPKSREVI